MPNKNEQHDAEHPDTREHTAPAAKPPDQPPVDQAAKDAQAAGSIGAQVILDFNGDGSLGARGGISALMNENVAARDAHLISLGLDPVAPSGPPMPGTPVAAAEPPPAPVRSPTATRVSSLAAGILTGDEPKPTPAHK
jgi:hypothetical protein